MKVRVRGLLGVLLIVLTGGLVLRRRRGRVPPRRRGDGGGLAGDREPRRPLPTTLVGAAAADPREYGD